MSAKRTKQRVGVGRAATAGVLAAAVVVGIGHLVAAIVAPDSAPVLVVGASIVDRTPQPVKTAIIEQFGARDKLVLFACIGVGVLLLGAATGLLVRRTRYGGAVFVVLGLAVAALAHSRPNADALSWVATAVGVAAGLAALAWMLSPRSAVDRSRREFLGIAAAVATVAAGAYVGSRVLATKLRDIAADRLRFPVPQARMPAPPVRPDMRIDTPSITPFTTPNRDFYRVDTALRIPAVSAAEWRLRIHGMVDRETVLTFEDLRSRQAVESMITLTCVSNEVGGNLAGNAVWTGYPIAGLLAEAGVAPDADMVLSRSVDGFTAGTPLAALRDGRDALLAVAMNGEPLPLAHGYPARLVVPGLYGYVSATKWVIDLEVTRFDRAQAYWTTRGWAEQAPIKTASRIDVPAAFGTVDAGPVVVAGVAWAQRRGIRSVEVQIDDGPWQRAELAAEYSIDTWRQWRWRWDATAGNHTIRVRATDGTGQRQTADRAAPIPDGASGWHSRVVTVR